MKDAAEREQVRGAKPDGAGDERSSATAVREMFDSIAPRYDLLNHVLSGSVDRVWWARTARIFSDVLQNPNAIALDLCSGTGDMALAMDRHARRVEPDTARTDTRESDTPRIINPRIVTPRIIALDFSHAMLRRGAQKFAGTAIAPVEGDALRLPFRDATFDLVVTSFGFRNLANYDAGLREMLRVLKPGGEAGILDFNMPGGVFGKIYSAYFHGVLPRIGRLLSGSKGAYDYLPASVERFPEPAEMLERMGTAGFAPATWTAYTFGIAGLYRGRKG